MTHSDGQSAFACSRREFLGGALALGAAAVVGKMAGASDEVKNLEIVRVETYPVRYETAGRFKFFEDAKGRPTGRQTVVVRITASDGTQGWGQSVPTPRWSYETLESVHTTIERYLAPVLIGRDPLDIEGAHAAMDRAIAPSFSTGQPICKAGIDLALWDLAGRAKGQSIAQMWGLRGEQAITLSWTLNPAKLDDIEPLIEEGRRAGYRNFNVKVAPDPKYDIELCRRVKKAAPDGFLWADANGGYDLATALQVIPKLADAGVEVLEQPLPSNRLTGYREIRRLKALPILMDEGLVSSVDLEEFVKLELLDGVAMKPARCGGLTDAKRQIEIARKHGLMVLGSGLTDPDISLAASLALYGPFGLTRPAALNGPQLLKGTVLKAPLKVEDGTLRVPDGPGLGVEVDTGKLASGP